MKKKPFGITLYEIIGLLILLPVAFVFGMKYQSLRRQIPNEQNVTEPDTFGGTAKGTCPSYGISDKSTYLRIYIVRTGDTIEEIARTQLGNVSRADEIRNLNSDTVPTKTAFPLTITPGKQIYLPPDYIHESTGYLTEYKVEITRITDTGLWYGYYETSPYYEFAPDRRTLYRTKKPVKVGDCVKVLEDVQKLRRVLSISSNE